MDRSGARRVGDLVPGTGGRQHHGESIGQVVRHVPEEGGRLGREHGVAISGPAGLGQPPKRLVGFQKVALAPGGKKTVQIVIDPNAASHPLGTWDTASQQWKMAGGQ
ncbi:fibronectin type III-like domain-contianing protein [Caballeronia sp. J97]|uniref:fibronectin type III-like domain-contianing protein n=1 Tax=Caballeronia sp. J97 TaxID=2805429 RepID=UPI002AAF12C3|nr:fibronectin type III-like domain-contianing protein [Caballeronia sp. J97]